MRMGYRHCLFVVIVALSINGQSVHSQDKIRLGLSSVSATNGGIWVAADKGIFKKHGVDVEVIVIGGGGARAISALVAGEIQFTVGGGDGSIRSALRGADVVIAASTFNTGVQRLMARPPIKSYQEIRGKKIGITRFGSAAHLILQLMLKKWNLKTEDVQTLQLGSSPAMLASLDKGGIDAAVLTMPTFFVAEDRGHVNIADPANMEIYYLQNTLETSRAFLRKNREVTSRFMKGYIEGIAYLKRNRRESIEVLRKHLRIQSEQERDNRYLEMSYNLLATSYFKEIPRPSIPAIQTVLDYVAADEPKAKGVDPRSFADESLVREHEESGFIKSLYNK